MLTSPGIPDKYVDWAAGGEIVVVAGANQALKYRRRIWSGLGTRERPFSGTQSIEAAVALVSRTGRPRRILYAWGYGVPAQPSREYFYRARDERVYEIRFINEDAVANTFNYSEPAVRDDARRLRLAIETSRLLEHSPVLFIGCSWAAAVIDYGLTLGAGNGRLLPGPGVALAGPRTLLACTRRRPYLAFSLSDNGDHGRLWVQRHPHDPIGRGGLYPLLYFLNKHRHDYGHRSDSVATRAWVWGISEEPAASRCRDR